MKPLYEISQDLRNVESIIDTLIDSDGQIENDELFVNMVSSLDANKDDIKTKSLNIARMIKNKKSEKDSIDNEIKNLQIRSKRNKSFIEWYTKYLEMNLPKETLSDSNTEIKWRKSTIVQANVDLLDDDYTKVKFERTPDKLFIKQMIEAGKDIEGASLIEKQNIQIK